MGDFQLVKPDGFRIFRHSEALIGADMTAAEQDIVFLTNPNDFLNLFLQLTLAVRNGKAGTRISEV